MILHFHQYLIITFVSYSIICQALEIPQTTVHMSDGDVINISLNNYSTSNTEEQAFLQQISINNNSHFIVHIFDIPDVVSFIILQVHTHMHSVSLSYDKNLNKSPGKFINGTNIGLFIETDNSFAEASVTNENLFAVHSLLAVVAYTNNVPYPGGCNMEFDIEKSPFQKLTCNKDVIIVDAQLSSVPKIGNVEPLCEKHPVQHDTYRMYMSEHDFSKESYFSAIAQMLTVQDIKKNAYLIPMSSFGPTMRRVYSRYPGTGSVFGVVANIDNYSSAYVPTFTYGCLPSSSTITDEVFSALSFFVGFFLIIYGSLYYKISMFLITMLVVGYYGHIFILVLLSYIEVIITADIRLLSSLIGILTSLLLMNLQAKSSIPSAIICVLALGTFFFNVMYFTIPVGMIHLEFNAYYGLIYFVFIQAAMTFHIIFPLDKSLCFSIIGAYAIVFAIDYYSGSYLKYILINGIRRITVQNFNVAVIQPPYQYKDILLTIIGSCLSIFSLFKLQFLGKKYVNLIMCRNNQIKIEHNERTPLL